MLRYLTRRLFLLLPALLILSILVFALLRLIPGDPAEVMLGEHATAEQIGQFRASRGLDQPIPIQYVPAWPASCAGTGGGARCGAAVHWDQLLG